MAGKIKGLTKVHKQRIRAWVKALRSGKYEQVRNKLMKPVGGGGMGYCCLGVAECVRVKNMATGGHRQVIAFEDAFYLPDVAVEYFGFDRVAALEGDKRNPRLGADLVPAAVLNDDKDMSFAQIADLVEATYLQ